MLWLILIAFLSEEIDASTRANCKSGRLYLNQSIIAVGHNVDPSKYDFTVDYGASNIRVIINLSYTSYLNMVQIYS